MSWNGLLLLLLLLQSNHTNFSAKSYVQYFLEELLFYFLLLLAMSNLDKAFLLKIILWEGNEIFMEFMLWIRFSNIYKNGTSNIKIHAANSHEIYIFLCHKIIFLQRENAFPFPLHKYFHKLFFSNIAWPKRIYNNKSRKRI